ncbi:hypothetical protein [Caulobacter sp.]|nr:hypothetical protein [Caulobacter sp.]
MRALAPMLPDFFADGPLWLGDDGRGVGEIGQSVRVGLSQR